MARDFSALVLIGLGSRDSGSDAQPLVEDSPSVPLCVSRGVLTTSSIQDGVRGDASYEQVVRPFAGAAVLPLGLSETRVRLDRFTSISLHASFYFRTPMLRQSAEGSQSAHGNTMPCKERPLKVQIRV